MLAYVFSYSVYESCVYLFKSNACMYSHIVSMKVVFLFYVIGELVRLLVKVARVMSGRLCLWVEGFEEGLLLICALALPPL